MNKQQLLEAICANLRDMAARAEAARRQAQEDANSHLGRLQSRYDTFKEEAQFLAAAQQHRAAEIDRWLCTLERLLHTHPEALGPADAARVGALVSVAFPENVEVEHYFLLPVGDGSELHAENRVIRPLSIHAPLARRLLGRRIGDRVRGMREQAGEDLVIVGIE